MAKYTCAFCAQPFISSSVTVGSEIICPNCGTKNTVMHQEAPVVQIPKLKSPAQREPGDLPVAATANRLIDNIEKVIVGKHDEILQTVMAYFAEGHVLLEDVPGVAQNHAGARAFAEHWLRLQTHPMHAGFAAERHHGQLHFQSKTTEFEFRPGPLLRKSCWRTKSTAPRRGRRPRCWKPWRNEK